MKSLFEYLWYENTLLAYLMVLLLLPFSGLFFVASALRRWVVSSQQAAIDVPVIVVGNIAIGGAGKTPLCLALIEHLQKQGIHVGMVSRGYGGTGPYPLMVEHGVSTIAAGDEAVMIYQRCQVPIVVDPDRVNACQYLLAQHQVDVIISDDGLQHYYMQRHLEIAVMDSQRGVGNGLILPAGPLREMASRLDTVDCVVMNGQNVNTLAADRKKALNDAFTMILQPMPLRAVNRSLASVPPEKGATVHAVAGIGHPQRFYNTLTSEGYQLIQHSFDDHYVYQENDLLFANNDPVIMTEKDAVKCQSFSRYTHHWYLPIQAKLPEDFWCYLDQQLKQLLVNSSPGNP